MTRSDQKYRVVIKDLREPDGRRKASRVVISDGLSQADSQALLKRFPKLKWSERRPGILTIDHIALVIELDN